MWVLVIITRVSGKLSRDVAGGISVNRRGSYKAVKEWWVKMVIQRMSLWLTTKEYILYGHLGVKQSLHRVLGLSSQLQDPSSCTIVLKTTSIYPTKRLCL